MTESTPKFRRPIVQSGFSHRYGSHKSIERSREPGSARIIHVRIRSPKENYGNRILPTSLSENQADGIPLQPLADTSIHLDHSATMQVQHDPTGQASPRLTYYESASNRVSDSDERRKMLHRYHRETYLVAFVITVTYVGKNFTYDGYFFGEQKQSLQRARFRDYYRK